MPPPAKNGLNERAEDTTRTRPKNLTGKKEMEKPETLRKRVRRALFFRKKFGNPKKGFIGKFRKRLPHF